jgi:hypothetical protein
MSGGPYLILAEFNRIAGPGYSDTMGNPTAQPSAHLFKTFAVVHGSGKWFKIAHAKPLPKPAFVAHMSPGFRTGRPVSSDRSGNWQSFPSSRNW